MALYSKPLWKGSLVPEGVVAHSLRTAAVGLSNISILIHTALVQYDSTEKKQKRQVSVGRFFCLSCYLMNHNTENYY